MTALIVLSLTLAAFFCAVLGFAIIANSGSNIRNGELVLVSWLAFIPGGALLIGARQAMEYVILLTTY